ncbi:MAG: serine hydrolase domain-containing protein [Isosphaeraceae bacterium]
MRILRRAFPLMIALVPVMGRGEDIASKIDDSLRARVKNDRFCGAILVARDGKVLARRGYGMANLELEVPNTPETRFRLGSLTKQFTATALMILRERGKVDVHEKVKTYLPESPRAWDEVTLHHLLTHTSGIPSYTSLPDYLTRMREPTTPDQLLARFKDRPLEFPPGSKYQYSNSGYAVLGKVIEAVSGRGYADFLHEAIFEPLNMKNTGYDRSPPILKHRASGYTRSLLATINADYLDMSIPYAAGGLYSTVDDLLLWDRALDSEKLVSRKTLEMMFTPFKENYGYGWLITREFGRAMLSHQGGINGFVTDIRRFPDEKLCVIVMSNFEVAPVESIAHDLSAIALGEPISAPVHRQGGKAGTQTKKADAPGSPCRGEGRTND